MDVNRYCPSQLTSFNYHKRRLLGSMTYRTIAVELIAVGSLTVCL